MIPAGWTEKKLGELCNVAIGKTPNRGSKEYWDTALQTDNTWLSIADLSFAKNKIVDTSMERISDTAVPIMTRVVKGTLLLSFKLTIGRVAFAGKDLYTNEAIAQLPIKSDVQIDKYYLYYYLSAFDYETLLKGDIKVKGKSLNKQKLNILPVSYPSLLEQQRIVEKLDTLFADIEKEKQIAQQNLQNAKELFESELNKLFTENTGWEHKKLSEVAIDFGRGKSKHRPRNDKCLYGGPYPFIQTGDIRNSKHYITSYTQTYNETGLAQSKLWPKGTLCITIAANIAETGILDFDACFPDSVIGCTFDNNKTNACFVEYLLQSFKSVLQAKGKGSAQDNINLGTFENQFFPFPEKSVQDSIVQKLDTLREQIQELEQIYTQQITDLDELKQAILKKAFNGEL